MPALIEDQVIDFYYALFDCLFSSPLSGTNHPTTPESMPFPGRCRIPAGALIAVVERA